MPFSIHTRPVHAGGRDDVAIELNGESSRAEVWPRFGFNCLRWQVRRADGEWGDVIYCDPGWVQNPVPTRSGHPILFPFPNRLRNGRFVHEGHEYQLPLTDATGTHAIHGFAPRVPWRVLATGVSSDSAFVTGQLRLSEDLPLSLEHWPADFVLTVTYRLAEMSLTVEAVVENPDSRSLPFGLGYHPYFRCPNVSEPTADKMILCATPDSMWELVDSFPTGRKVSVFSEYDFRAPRRIGSRPIDHLYTTDSARSVGTESDALQSVAWLGHESATGRVVVSADAAFRELLLFVPPHRRAVAIEPYTCATDAAHLPDSGWQTLPAGGRFSAVVRYEWVPQ